MNCSGQQGRMEYRRWGYLADAVIIAAEVEEGDFTRWYKLAGIFIKAEKKGGESRMVFPLHWYIIILFFVFGHFFHHLALAFTMKHRP